MDSSQRHVLTTTSKMDTSLDVLEPSCSSSGGHQDVFEKATSSSNCPANSDDAAHFSCSLLQEHSSMQYLVDLIPSRAQKGFLTTELKLTCIDATTEYVALGSSIGTVFLFRRSDRSLLRLRVENYGGWINCIQLRKAGDCFIAAGTVDGPLLIFQILHLRDSVEVSKFKIENYHSCAITGVEMSPNGEYVFSGDLRGNVVQTTVDYQNESCVSVAILEEGHEVVQLSYRSHWLAVSTLKRSVLHHINDNTTIQIGKQERKSLGCYGATIIPSTPGSIDVIVYAMRPNFRIWKSTVDGVVQETIILTERQSSRIIPLISEPPVTRVPSDSDQLEMVSLYNGIHLLIWNKKELVIMDIAAKKLIGECFIPSGILDITSVQDEIFILLPTRKLIRLATAPEISKEMTESKAEEVPLLQDIALPFQEIKKVVKERSATFSSVVGSKSLDSTKLSAFLPQNKKFFGWMKSGFSNITHVAFSKSGRAGSNASNASATSTEEESRTDNVRDDAVPLKSMQISTGTSQEINITVDNSEETKSPIQISDDSETHIPSPVQVDNLDGSPSIIPNEISTLGESSVSSGVTFEDDGTNIVYSRKKKKVRKRHGRSKSPQPAAGELSGCSSLNFDNSSCSSEGAETKLETKLDPSSEESSSTGSNIQVCHPKEKESSPEKQESIDHQPRLGLHVAGNEDDNLRRILEAYSRTKTGLAEEGVSESGCSREEKVHTELKNSITPTTVCEDAEPTKSKTHNVSKHIESIPLIIEKIDKTETDGKVSSELRPPYSPEPSEDASANVPLVIDCDIDTSSMEVFKGSSELDVTSDLSAIDNNANFQEIYTSDWVEYRVPTCVVNVSACDHYLTWIDNKDVLYYASLKSKELSWFSTDRKAHQVSVSPSGNILWILYKNTAYSASKPSDEGPLTSHWLGAADDVKFISVDDESAWYIGLYGELYTQQKLSHEQPLTYPKKIDCQYNLQQVSCLQGVVWALTACGKIICSSVSSVLHSPCARWRQVRFDFQVSSIALGMNNIGWVIDTGGKLWFRYGVTSMSPSGLDDKWWKTTDCFCDIFQLAGFRNISSHNAPPSGKLSSKNHHGDVELREIPFTNTAFNDMLLNPENTPLVMDEESIYQSALKLRRGCFTLSHEVLTAALLGSHQPTICATVKGIWYCRPGSNIIHVNRRNMVGHRWVRMNFSTIGSSSKWTHLSAVGMGDDHGLVWAVHCSGELICFASDGVPLTIATPVNPSEILCLASAFEALWILTKSGEIHIRKGIHHHRCPTGSVWEKLNLFQLENAKLVHMSLSGHVVWACDINGRILMRLGTLNSSMMGNLTPAWMFVDGDLSNSPPSFTKVFVGPTMNMVWAIDIKKKVYVRDGVSSDLPVGTDWLLVPEIEAKDIAVSSDAVWVLTPNSEIYRRFGISESSCAGDYWRKIAGNMESISVTASDELWALSTEGHLYHHSAHLLKFEQSPKPPYPSATSPKGDEFDDTDEEWILL